MSSNLQLAIKATKSAGALIHHNYVEAKKLIKKDSNDYATETDIAAEKLIIDILRQTGYSILGEETGETDNHSNRKWIIDPLDGTINFIRGFPFFCVSIALMEGDNRLILGVIYDPIRDECYWAENKKGAYLNGKKINMAKSYDGDRSMILIDHGSSRQSKQDYLKALESLTKQDTFQLMRHGTTALMLCYVAKGSAEAFLSCGDEIYDYAAGLIIAREAGAVISDWEGEAWNDSSSYILASNFKLQPEIVDKVSHIQK